MGLVDTEYFFRKNAVVDSFVRTRLDLTNLRSKLDSFALKYKSSEPAMKTMVNPLAVAMTYDKHCPLNVALKAVDCNSRVSRQMAILRKRLTKV
jgi:hypothetical protein